MNDTELEKLANSESLKEWVQEQSKAIQYEMDWKIIAASSGWTNVQLTRYSNNNQAVDIKLWLEENCKSKWDNLGTHFIFEKKKDAEWFMLRWQ